MSRKFALIAALLASAVLAPVASSTAQAMPVVAVQSDVGAPAVTLVAGGCGVGWHRSRHGHCRPNRAAVVVPQVVVPPVVVAPFACPLGYHVGPRGHCRVN